MKQGLKLLVLAGSAEARQIAQAAQAAGAQVQAWVSEPPRGPNPMPVATALHRFDDPARIVAAMSGFDAVIDASHGFDDLMSRVGAQAAAQLGLPCVHYSRAPWDLGENENWIQVADVAAAVAVCAAGTRAFSATGWASLDAFAGFKGARVFLRQTTPHNRPSPFDFVQLVFGDPPFSVASETALFKELRIDTLICRNLGGRASRPKLDAAQKLGLKVILIAPPPLGQGMQRVHNIEAALAWVTSQ